MNKRFKKVLRKASNFAMLAVLGASALLSAAPAFAADTNATIRADLNEKRASHMTMPGGEKNEFFYMAPIYLDSGSGEQLVFCVDPATAVVNGPGYEKNPFLLNRRVNLISTLWKQAGTDWDTYFVAQEMIYNELGTTIGDIDGISSAQRQQIKNKINNVITNYEKKPSFANQTVKMKLGEPVTLTDTNGSDLSAFNNVDTNSANVDFKVNGDKLTITPKENSNPKGQLILEKSLERGTPYVWKRAGSQSVASSGVADPADFLLNFEIETTGSVKISKTDQDTGAVVPGTKFDLTYQENDKDVTKSVTTGTDGTATLDGVPHDAKVKVKETFVPAPYVLASAVGGVDTKDVVVKAGYTSTVDFKNQVATGSSTLTKIDKTTESNESLNPNYSMTGAVYGFFKEDGTLIKEFTLDDTLTASIENQDLGNYYWQETKAPVGYVLDKTKHEVALTYKDQVTPVVVVDSQSQDDVIRMNMDGQKLIENDTNEMYKNGVELTATNKRTEETTVVTTAKVDGKAGYFAFENLPLDDYVITETKGVEGYQNIDPIEVNHVYNEEDGTFTFTVKDQKTGNLLNEEVLTQEQLQDGVNVDLGTYTLRDKAEISKEKSVGISTQAHTGDGESQTFVWGEDATFYDDSSLTHKNIEVGTKRAYETKLHAKYKDKDGNVTDEVVWESGLVDYEVSDEVMTNKVIAEYDYKKDPKADENTVWYFSEDGYNYDKPEEPTKDTEHNPKGDDPKQTITPEKTTEPVKPVEPVKPDTPKTPDYPVTGEQVIKGLSALGAVVVLAAGGFYVYNKKRNA